jgi:acetyltransferase-like isoleucine patch superfamily enzyme
MAIGHAHVGIASSAASTPPRRRRAAVDPRLLLEEIPPGVSLGRGSLVDHEARLGLVPSRPGRSSELRVGVDALMQSGVAIYLGCEIGDSFVAEHNVVIHEDTVIGNGTRIGANTVIGRGCRIGNRVRIGANCYVAALTTLDDEVLLASGVSLANDPHPGSATALCARGPVVSRGAQIGTNATLLPSVTIGQYALVGAGSVVTRDVRPRTVVVGNPARVLKGVADVRCPLDLTDGSYLRPPARTAV